MYTLHNINGSPIKMLWGEWKCFYIDPTTVTDYKTFKQIKSWCEQNLTDTKLAEKSEFNSQYENSLPEYECAANGFVYLGYLPEESGREVYKIGQTVNIKRRENQLRKKYGKEFRIILNIVANNAIRLESWFHNKFKEKRVFGEFFEITHIEAWEFAQVSRMSKGMPYEKVPIVAEILEQLPGIVDTRTEPVAP